MHRAGNAGFSLIELMVTIAILAILLAIAFPSFEGSMRSNRLATTTNELLASVSLARSEAIKNTHGAGICASADGLTCSNDWNLGWLVWADGGNVAANHGSFQQASDTVIRVVDAHPRLVLDVHDGASASAPVSRIGFDYRGRPVGVPTPATFNLQPDTCPAGQELVRELTLNASGQLINHKAACTP